MTTIYWNLVMKAINFGSNSYRDRQFTISEHDLANIVGAVWSGKQNIFPVILKRGGFYGFTKFLNFQHDTWIDLERVIYGNE